MPDILVIHDGRYIGFECKSPDANKRYDQEHQKTVRAEIEAAGGQVYVVTSLEEAQAAMKEAVNQLARAV
jgi:hypothetical protein